MSSDPNLDPNDAVIAYRDTSKETSAAMAANVIRAVSNLPINDDWVEYQRKKREREAAIYFIEDPEKRTKV